MKFSDIVEAGVDKYVKRDVKQTERAVKLVGKRLYDTATQASYYHKKMKELERKRTSLKDRMAVSRKPTKDIGEIAALDHTIKNYKVKIRDMGSKIGSYLATMPFGTKKQYLNTIQKRFPEIYTFLRVEPKQERVDQLARDKEARPGEQVAPEQQPPGEPKELIDKMRREIVDLKKQLTAQPGAQPANEIRDALIGTLMSDMYGHGKRESEVFVDKWLKANPPKPNEKIQDIIPEFLAALAKQKSLV